MSLYTTLKQLILPLEKEKAQVAPPAPGIDKHVGYFSAIQFGCLYNPKV
jgi:hypothetical protein